MPPRNLFDLEEAEAEAYLAEYRAAAPERLAWLEQVAAGIPLDRTPDSLVPLWRWFVAWHDAGGSGEGDPEGVPMWYEPDPPGTTALPPAALWRVDGIGYYLGEVAAANLTEVRWAVATSPKRLRYVDRNKPVLVGPTGVRFGPLEVVYVGALRLVLFGGERGAREDDDLLRVYRLWEEKLGGEGG